MKNRPVTIKDIARKLNISVSTVSRALRGSSDINPETKKVVLDLAAELDYQPNTIALSLVKSKTNIVGVMIPDITIPFFASAIKGIQEVASAAGYNVMICQSGESEEIEKNNTQALLSSRVAGLIVSVSGQTKNFDHFRNVQRRGVPLVFFDRVPEEIEAAKVLADDYNGAFKAVEHLIQMGNKRIAHLAGPELLKLTQNRKRGYLDALQKHNVPVDPTLIIHSEFNRKKAYEATNQLLDLPNPPDAIFAISDRVAIGAIMALKDRNKRIPEDVAVVGFGNEATSSILDPALTTVMQHPSEMGRIAAQLFLEQVNTDPEKYVPKTEVLNTELILNKSSKRL
ncbi:LacI family transcriptional regulator [Adhaeribacter aerolatus]|uniref:LacI family transcriptional regulator n=1 Tax=Adhaeribacter aerolatus TaxID=670289 RepID=A0A512ATB1_9BACT|nr:LacI family DNA-binding transcriptional regulator [Adhaeribacter aerolatus]GEO02952.1 LacI family transcriptional regulator [Adhaeribacter aerolatus]